MFEKTRTLDIYLIRHAESIYNADYNRIIGGRSSEISLSKKGIEQAKILGKRLLEEKIFFDHAYSSTARRAVDTAQIVYDTPGYPYTYIQQSDSILELDQGDLTGRIRAEIYTPEFKKFLDENSWTYIPPNGESQEMVAERMYNFLIFNTKEPIFNPGKKIALFTHGNAIKCLLRKIMGFHPKYIYRMNIDNTSITELTYDEENEYRIIRVNDAAHLIQ
jgi:broad specificity phosphatase PhoE